MNIKQRWWLRGYYLKKVKQFFCRHKYRELNSYFLKCDKCKKFKDKKLCTGAPPTVVPVMWRHDPHGVYVECPACCLRIPVQGPIKSQVRECPLCKRSLGLRALGPDEGGKMTFKYITNRVRDISQAVENNFFDWLFIYQVGILACYMIAVCVIAGGG